MLMKFNHKGEPVVVSSPPKPLVATPVAPPKAVTPPSSLQSIATPPLVVHDKSILNAPTPPSLIMGSTINDVIKAYQKSQQGKDISHTIMKGSHIPTVPRYATGIFELDYYLGGGFPGARFSIIYGPESSDKTNVALCAVAQAQKRPAPRNKAVWVNLEQTFDPLWAALMGVDVDQLIVLQASYGEEAVDLILGFLAAEDLAILVVDSIAVLSSNKELGQSVEKFDVGTTALLIKRLCNKMMFVFGDCIKVGHFPCVLLINQTRFKIGVLFGDPETMPGGQTQRFLSSLTLRLAGKNVKDDKINPNIPIFKEVTAVVKKAKVPVQSTSFKFQHCMCDHNHLKIGWTDSWDMVKTHLQDLGILAKDKGYYFVDGEYSGEMKDGLPQLRKWSLLNDIRDSYYTDSFLRMRLQMKVVAASNPSLIVEEPIVNSPQSQIPGEVNDLEMGEKEETV
jgi:recombination protein RecA